MKALISRAENSPTVFVKVYDDNFEKLLFSNDYSSPSVAVNNVNNWAGDALPTFYFEAGLGKPEKEEYVKEIKPKLLYDFFYEEPSIGEQASKVRYIRIAAKSLLDAVEIVKEIYGTLIEFQSIAYVY